MGLGLRLGDAPYDFVEDGWAGAGDAVSGMGVGFHPGEEEDERNPAADVVFELGADLVESGEELDRETNGGDFQHAGIGAVRGGRGDQVFAADERADGVDGAGPVSYTHLDVYKRQRLSGLRYYVPEGLKPDSF